MGFSLNPFTGQFDNTGSSIAITPGGSNKQIQFNDSSSFGGDADLVWDKTNNVLSIGTDTPNAFSGLSSAGLEIANQGGGHSDINLRVALGYGTVYFAASGGTLAIPTTIPAGNGVGAFSFKGYDGSLYREAGFLGFQIPSAATVSSSSMPGDLFFQNTLRRHVSTSLNSIAATALKTLGLWASTASLPTTNFQVFQPTTVPGVVATNGSATLTGTETNFLNDFKPGDTINVTGETARTVLAVVSNTSLTVTSTFSTTASGLVYTGSARTVLTIRGNGQIGLNTTTPSAYLHLPAGAAAVNNAPLKFTSGTNLTVVEAGSVEYNGNFLLSNSALRFPVGGTLFDHYADVSNSGTSETDLYTDTLAASTFNGNGDKIIVQYGGTFSGAVTSTQQLRAYFGGTLIFDSGALSIGAATDSWNLNIVCVRETSGNVRCTASLTTNFATLSSYATYTKVTGLTLSNTQILKITGTAAGINGASNQITASEGYVTFLPAA